MPKAVTSLTGIEMGLARTNGFIESLQGKIEVRSNPAQGRRFTTGLPVGRESSSQAFSGAPGRRRAALPC